MPGAQCFDFVAFTHDLRYLLKTGGFKKPGGFIRQVARPVLAGIGAKFRDLVAGKRTERGRSESQRSRLDESAFSHGSRFMYGLLR